MSPRLEVVWRRAARISGTKYIWRRTTDASIGIVNMVSVTGTISAGGLGRTAYEASKAAAEAFTDSLRFSGYLRKKSFGHFGSEKFIVPLVMDVTDDGQVEAAARAVRQWLLDAHDGSRPERLHAVVNNVSVGYIGLIDLQPVFLLAA